MGSFLITIIFIIFLFILFYKFRIKISKNKKANIASWMNMSRSERDKVFFQDNIRIRDRKKALINEIRKEYKKIKNNI